MKRFTILAAASLMGAAVCAQTIKTSDVSDRYQLEALGMSSNHRYVVGLNVANYKSFVWDTQEGTVMENRGDYANCDFRSVTNDGVAYGILGADDMVTTNAACFDREGRVSFIESEMSQIFDVTPDGKIAVGCLLDDIMWWPTACIWKDGERLVLPCPTEAECGIANDGANAQFVSADGKVIAGYLQDWASSRPAIVWRLQEDGSYKADVVSNDVWELRYGQGKPYLKFEPLAISDNGRWLALAAQKEAGGSMPTPELMVRMNLETGEIIESETPDIEYFMEEADHCYPAGIADDGTCVGSIRDELGFQRGVIWKADAPAPVLLADEYPELSMLQDYDGFMHLPIAISADGKHIAGFGCPVTVDVTGAPDYDFVAYLISSSDQEEAIASIRSARLSQQGKYDLSGRRIPAGQQRRGMVIENQKKYIR